MSSFRLTSYFSNIIFTRPFSTAALNNSSKPDHVRALKKPVQFGVKERPDPNKPGDVKPSLLERSKRLLDPAANAETREKLYEKCQAVLLGTGLLHCLTAA